MKHKFSLIALMMIILVSAAITVMAISESTEQLEKPEIVTFSVNDFDLAIDELNENTIQSILFNTENILTGSERVCISDNPYTREFIRVHPEIFGSSASTDDGQLLLMENTYDVSSNAVQYLVLLSHITDEYADCIVHSEINYPSDIAATNRAYFHGFFVCPSFRDSGYESIEDYYRAILSGECDVPEDAYTVYYQAPAIWKYNTRERLELFPDDTVVS